MWVAMLADLAVKTTALLAVAWTAALLLRRQSAAVRHLVWTAAATAVFLLPFLFFSLPGLPVRGAGALLPGSGVVFQATATAGAGEFLPARPPVPASSGYRASAAQRLDWPLWLAILWMSGSVILLAQMLVACAAISRLRRAARPWPDAGAAAPHGVDLLRTSAGSMPMTYGIVRPAVFLPADAAAWNDDLRRAVLLHELAHVRRGDVATQILARVSLALHWWNPLAWTAWRQFLKERERAADDMVLAAGTRASDYAAHLLQMARSRQSAPILAWAAVCMARRSQLEGRLTAILNARTCRTTPGRKTALATTLVAVGLAAPLAAVRAQQAAPHAVAPVVDAAIRAIAPQAVRPANESPAPADRPEQDESRTVGYGVGLLKIADLERQRHRTAEAEAFYSKAAAILGDRAEAAPAWLYLGSHEKNPEEAIEYLRKAERLDPAQASKARLWMALARERQQRHKEAEALFKSALSAAKPGSADAGSAAHLYARFLEQQARGGEAKAVEKQAETSRQTAAWRPGVYRVGDGVKAPALLSKVEPEYSEEARTAKYQGTVRIYAEIGTDGRAHNLRVLRGLGLGLDEKAMEAINNWRFRPGSKDGTPVPVAATIEVNFRLL